MDHSHCHSPTSLPLLLSDMNILSNNAEQLIVSLNSLITQVLSVSMCHGEHRATLVYIANHVQQDH